MPFRLKHFGDTDGTDDDLSIFVSFVFRSLALFWRGVADDCAAGSTFGFVSGPIFGFNLRFEDRVTIEQELKKKFK